MRKLSINGGGGGIYSSLLCYNATMEFRVRVGTLERRIVCSFSNVQNMQIVKRLKHSKCSSCWEQKTLEESDYIKHYVPISAY